MTEIFKSTDISVNTFENKASMSPIAVYTSMLASPDSLFDDDAVTAPSTPCANKLFEYEKPVDVKRNNTFLQRKIVSTPTTKEKVAVSSFQDDDDSDEYLSADDDEEKITIDEPETQKTTDSKSMVSEKHELNEFISAERTLNEFYCIQTAINSGYLSLDSIIEKVKEDIRNGVYQCKESSGFLQKDASNQVVESKEPSNRYTLTDQPNKISRFSLNLEHSQPFYSTTSTPKMARAHKRRSAMATAIKKKNCIIL